jgi:hypothetical protein
MPFILLLLWMALNIIGFWIRKRFFGASAAMGIWGILFFFSPLLILVGWIAWDPFMSIASGRLPDYVLSGKLFTDKFDIGHAGSALDQPTIGKWLFWFTLMTILSLPYIANVRRISDRTSRMDYWVFAVLTVTICVMLFSILSWPLCWLIQYIHSMGVTNKRIWGLTYAVAASIGVVLFLFWAVYERTKNHDLHS